MNEGFCLVLYNAMYLGKSRGDVQEENIISIIRVILNMEAILYTKILVDFDRTTCHHTLEDRTLYIYRSENLGSYRIHGCFIWQGADGRKGSVPLR
jgi:hypothetical protein